MRGIFKSQGEGELVDSAGQSAAVTYVFSAIQDTKTVRSHQGESEVDTVRRFRGQAVARDSDAQRQIVQWIVANSDVTLHMKEGTWRCRIAMSPIASQVELVSTGEEPQLRGGE